ncbi:MAG: hypothetical protein ACLQU2_21850 [Candidatus Binataceae bacterium]
MLYKVWTQAVTPPFTVGSGDGEHRRLELLDIAFYILPLTGGDGAAAALKRGSFFSAPSEARD